jgi:hypothetical protein
MPLIKRIAKKDRPGCRQFVHVKLTKYFNISHTMKDGVLPDPYCTRIQYIRKTDIVDVWIKGKYIDFDEKDIIEKILTPSEILAIMKNEHQIGKEQATRATILSMQSFVMQQVNKARRGEDFEVSVEEPLHGECMVYNKGVHIEIDSKEIEHMREWELKAMNSLILDMKTGQKVINGSDYSEGMMWYSDDRLTELCGAKFVELSHGFLVEIKRESDSAMFTYVKHSGGFELIHEGSISELFLSMS